MRVYIIHTHNIYMTLCMLVLVHVMHSTLYMYIHDCTVAATDCVNINIE